MQAGPDQTMAGSEAPAGRPLAGRHALVTGAGRGIGAAVAAELARLGADVSLTGRQAASLEQQRDRLVQASGVRIGVQHLDVRDEAGVEAAFAAAAEQLGPVTILVNNAGIGHAAPFEKTPVSVWRELFEVNVTGAVLCARAALPGMRAAGWGRIVNVASTASLIGYTHVSAYVASKHALLGLTRALALELARTGITVNAVCPGYTDTDLAREAVANIMRGSGRTETEARALLAKRNPQGRLIDPAEVAQAVGWLCLPASSAMSGQAIAVAGGEVT